MSEESKPISPVIVTFKALPGVRLTATESELIMSCRGCFFNKGRCNLPDEDFDTDCADRDYIWREVPPKEPK